MIPPVIFPDSELVVCEYLRATLPDYGYPSVFVSNVRGTQATAVWVRRDGGGHVDQVREAPRMAINVFAPTEQKAIDLARTVDALVVASPDGEPILKAIKTSGPSGVADAVGPRMYMTFDLYVRGVALEAIP